MKFCTMCGDPLTPGHLELHVRTEKDPRDKKVLPSLSIAAAFAKAFHRLPTEKEMDGIAAGDAEGVFERAVN